MHDRVVGSEAEDVEVALTPRYDGELADHCLFACWFHICVDEILIWKVKRYLAYSFNLSTPWPYFNMGIYPHRAVMENRTENELSRSGRSSGHLPP